MNCYALKDQGVLPMAKKKKRRQKPPPVKIVPAGAFTCDDCGESNYFTIPTFDRESIPPEVLEDMDDDGNGVIYGLPNEVHCRHCKAVYRPYEDDVELGHMLSDDNCE